MKEPQTSAARPFESAKQNARPRQRTRARWKTAAAQSICARGVAVNPPGKLGGG